MTLLIGFLHKLSVTFLAGLRLEGIFLQSGAAFESAVFSCIVSIASLSSRDCVATWNTPDSSFVGTVVQVRCSRRRVIVTDCSVDFLGEAQELPGNARRICG